MSALPPEADIAPYSSTSSARPISENLKTAKALGLNVPNTASLSVAHKIAVKCPLRLRADKQHVAPPRLRRALYNIATEDVMFALPPKANMTGGS